MTTGKTIALTRWTFIGKVMSLLFNMLSRLVITFLPKSKCLNFMATVTICSDFGAQKNKVSHCFPVYLPWSDGTKGNVPLGSLIFLKRPLVFPSLLFSSISLHWSLRKAFLSFSLLFFGTLHSDIYLSFLPLPLASLLFSTICNACSENQFAFYISFPWRWFWLPPPVQCYEPLPIVLQAFCVSDLIPWIYVSLPLYNLIRDLSHNWMVKWFSLVSSIYVWIWQ